MMNRGVQLAILAAAASAIGGVGVEPACVVRLRAHREDDFDLPRRGGPGPRVLEPVSRDYLKFAHRPMTEAQIAEHNAEVARRKAQAREAAVLARLRRTVEEVRR